MFKRRQRETLLASVVYAEALMMNLFTLPTLQALAHP